MISVKRWSILATGIALVLALAACGSPANTTTGSGSTPTSAPTSAPTTSSGNPYGASPTATSSSSSSVVVKVALAMVKGVSKKILTDSQGKTLYYFTPDTTKTSACTGSCAQSWPPLLFTGSGTPQASEQLPGKLTVVMTANGSQVAYNGHLLYTFAGDSSPGQTTGEGLHGKWFVATTDLKLMS